MDHDYAVFISYSHSDQEWVHTWLVPRLEGAHLRICIDTHDIEHAIELYFPLS